MKKIILLFIICTIASTGYAQDQLRWGNASVSIAYEQDIQYDQKIVIAPNGNVFISWIDNRAGNSYQLVREYDIYIQKLDINGNKYWPEDGLPVIVKQGKQFCLDMIFDGVDGVILAWTDDTNGNIYAQHIDQNGSLLWGEEGLLVNNGGEEINHKLVSDGVGGAFVIWTRDNFTPFLSIRAQHLTREGILLWPEDGIQVFDPNMYVEKYPCAISDDNGGLICLLNYSELGTNNHYLITQHLDYDGSKLWNDNGIEIAQESSYISNYCLVKDNEGGAIIGWRGDMAQRIDFSGNLLWGNGKQLILLPTPPPYEFMTQGMKIIPDRTGHFLMGKFQLSHTSSVSSYIDVQRFSSNGDLLWGNGVRTAEISDFNYYFDICNDSHGGMYTIWIDGNTSSKRAPYIQHLNKMGDKLWGLGNGIPLIDTIYSSYNTCPTAIEDNLGGAIILWQDTRSGAYKSRDIYGQRAYQNQRPLALGINVDPLFADEDTRIFFIGYGDDFDGAIVSYEWRSSINGKLSNEDQFYKDDLSPGQHEIYFKVQDDEDEWSDEISKNLHINALPEAFIDSINPSTLIEGEEVTFTGYGEDQDGTIDAYRWTSDIDGELSTESSFSTTKLSIGSHTITLMVQDNNGAWSYPAAKKVIVQQVAEQGAIYGRAYGIIRPSWGRWRRPRIKPLDNVNIQIKGWRTGTTETAISDQNGDYRVESLPQDLYIIKATKDGYMPSWRWTFSRKDTERRVNIFMRKRPPWWYWHHWFYRKYRR